MTPSEILQGAIEKAVGNGYKFPFVEDLAFSNFEMIYGNCWLDYIIFSHDFAKAFWGDNFVCSDCGLSLSEDCTNITKKHVYTTKSWKYHLQQLVLAEDRIGYLKQFI